MVHEVAQPPFALEEGDAPAVAVLAGHARAARETGEAERDVGGRVGVQAEQFAHQPGSRSFHDARIASAQVSPSIQNTSPNASSRACVVTGLDNRSP